MKSITLVLSILVLATAMFAQEPVNHAVSQPVALQPVAMQPAARESSALQIVHYVPPAPYLSEPLIIPPKQAVAHEEPTPGHHRSAPVHRKTVVRMRLQFQLAHPKPFKLICGDEDAVWVLRARAVLRLYEPFMHTLFVI